MTISKYLQKNAAEQDTASNTTLSPNEPTESNSSSLSETKPSVVTAEQTPENKPQKPLGKLLWESFCIILPPVLLLTAVGVVAYYILCPSKGEFHADCTDTLYWAKATYDSGKLINPDFSYACLLPFGGSLLMLLFLPLFGFSMTTNMMGMLVFFFLFTTSLCWMLRQMHWDSRWNCITAAAFLMLLSASKKLREIFWGHTIYYSLGILFLFFGLALLFRLQNLSAIRQTREIRMHTILTFIALFLFFILCCTDQITAITIFALPILAGLFLERVLDRKTPLLHQKNTRVLLLLLSLGIAIIAGMKLGNLWANGVAGAYADNYSNWTAQETWTEHFLPIAALAAPAARHSRFSAVSGTWCMPMWDTGGHTAVASPLNLPAKACRTVPSVFRSSAPSAAAAGRLRQSPFPAGTAPPVRKRHLVPAGAVLPMLLLPAAAQ